MNIPNMKKEIPETNSKRKTRLILFCRFFIFLSGLNVFNAFAGDGLNLRINKLYAPAPNAADLGRFSAMQVGLFTGSAKYSIPIYEFKTSNLTVPISLEYSSNGLVVDKVASWAGFDWTLNAGGVINRYRKGKVDRPGARSTYLLTNWNTMTLSDKRTHLQDNVFDNSANDLEPDEFTYSFMNYSGKFVSDELGNIKQIPYTNLKIETNTTGSEYTYFTIKTPDGICYKFDLKGYTSPVTEASYPTSYYLTQIIHPNGEVVNFNYTTISNLKQYTGVSQTATTVVQQNVTPSISLNEVTTQVNSFYSDVIYLDNIQFPNIGSIVFEKSATRQDNYGDYELKKIKILDNSSTLIKSFEFFHQFPVCSASYQSKTNIGITEPNSEHNKRMFLDSLQIQSSSATTPKISSYVFKYNNLTELPARYSFSQDHWGYFNGKSNSDFAIITEVPSNYRNMFTNMIPTTANRTPDYLYSQKGMLQKIIFPTRGYTTIEYEPHKDDSNNILGGCRVIRTKTYDSPTSIAPAIAKYVYSGTQTSLNYKYYTEYFNYLYDGSCSPKGNVTYGKLNSNSFYNLSVNGIYHILYSNVEILSGENAENGKEIHNFQIGYDQPGTPLNMTISDAMIYPLVMNNTGWKAGLLNSTVTKDNNSNTLINDALTYNFTETMNLKDISCLAVEKFYDPSCIWELHPESLQPYKVISYTIKSNWYYVNQEVVTKYLPSGNVITTKNYSYNDYGLQSNVSLTSSDGIVVETKTKYPSDVNTGVYSSMKNLNMLNYPIEVVNLKNNNVIGSELTTYKANGSNYVPDKVYSLESSAPFSSGSFTYFNGSTKDIHYSSTAELSYDVYNSANGNLRQTTSRDGITTAYLWDSYGNYQMANVKGATYSQISAQDGKICSYSSKTLWTDINSLVPSAFINTFGYYPVVGLKYTTNPKGVITYYDYDSFGRLKLIRNDDYHILSRYKYNYKL